MNTKIMAQRLIEKGFTQRDITRMINDRGVSVTQPTIHRILKGSDPSYTVGAALRNIYMDNCERPQRGVA